MAFDAYFFEAMGSMKEESKFKAEVETIHSVLLHMTAAFASIKFEVKSIANEFNLVREEIKSVIEKQKCSRDNINGASEQKD